jgi:hypothetical protein
MGQGRYHKMSQLTILDQLLSQVSCPKPSILNSDSTTTCPAITLCQLLSQLMVQVWTALTVPGVVHFTTYLWKNLHFVIFSCTRNSKTWYTSFRGFQYKFCTHSLFHTHACHVIFTITDFLCIRIFLKEDKFCLNYLCTKELQSRRLTGPPFEMLSVHRNGMWHRAHWYTALDVSSVAYSCSEKSDLYTKTLSARHHRQTEQSNWSKHETLTVTAGARWNRRSWWLRQLSQNGADAWPGQLLLWSGEVRCVMAVGGSKSAAADKKTRVASARRAEPRSLLRLQRHLNMPGVRTSSTRSESGTWQISQCHRTVGIILRKK